MNNDVFLKRALTMESASGGKRGWYKPFVDLCEFPLRVAGWTMMGSAIALTGVYKYIGGDVDVVLGTKDTDKASTSTLKSIREALARYAGRKLGGNEPKST